MFHGPKKMDSQLTIWQLNCHKSNLVHLEIEAKMRTENLKPVLLLQEQNLKRMENYTVHQRNTSSVRSRACICVPNNLNFVFLDELSNPDIASGVIRFEDGEEVMLVSAYMAGDKGIDDTLYRIMDYARVNTFEVVICSDANARATLWGCHETNLRGEALMDFMIETGLDLANLGDEPTYVRANVRSIIDVTMHTSGISNRIMDWRVEMADLLSDHRLISFQIQKSPSKILNLSRNLKKANWNIFREILKKSLCFSSRHYWTKFVLEREAAFVTAEITKALDVVAPKRVRTNKSDDTLWENPKFQMLRSRVKAANRRRCKHPSESNTNKYRLYRDELTKFKRDYEAAKWKSFCEQVSDPKDVAKFAKINCKRQKLQALKDNEENLHTRPAKVIDILRGAHFPGSITDPGPPPGPGQHRRCDVYDGSDLINTIVTEEKVRAAICSFGPFKAAGPDEFSPVVLQNLPRNVLQHYVELFRASILLNHVPTIWKESNVIFIPKTGKTSYEEAKAFRPITLSSFQLKILEKLLLWRINEQTLRVDPQSKHQHAFRKHYSTDTALSVVVDKAEQGLLNREYTLAVFLDIRGAFDNVKHSFVIRSLRNKGIEKEICDWYETYLSDRNSCITIGDQKSHFRLTRGVPQGGLISPLAFALCIDAYLENLNSHGSKTVAFADDLCVLQTSLDLGTAGNLIQQKLKMLERWAAEAGLNFNVEKTNAMVFTKRKKITYPKLMLLGKEIQYTNQLKYLGVTLTSKLNWGPHINEKVNACRRMLFMVLSMVRKSFQMSARGLRWLYTMCVRPKLLYASHIWSNGLTSTSIEKLRRINSLGCRILAPCWRSTPTRTLELLWNLKPLHILARENALATFLRIMPLIGNRVTNNVERRVGHLWTLKSECAKNDLMVEVENRDQTRFWNKSYIVAEFQELDQLQLLEDSNTRYAYTDGSGIDSNVGSGFVVRKARQNECVSSVALGPHRSVYQGELKAIDLAAEQLLERPDQAEFTEIRVDNQSVLSRLKSGLATNRLETQCMSKLTELGLLTGLTLRWVRAHIGTEGNELADNLAKHGITETDAQSVFVPFPASYRKTTIRSYTNRLWSEEWKTLLGSKHGHRNSKFWLSEPDPSRLSRELIKFDRNRISFFIAMISGHSSIGEHTSRTRGQNSVPLCRLCKNDQELNVHLLSCPELRHDRLLAFGTSDKEQISKHWTIPNMVQFANSINAKSILKDKVD